MTRRRRRSSVFVLAALMALALSGCRVWVSVSRSPLLANPGSVGYRSFTGPHGMPLPIGRPWGAPCQPIRFTVEEHVPDWVYLQAAEVVKEARGDGIDVAIESRQFMWVPRSLYYAPGQSPARTKRIAIYALNQAPPLLANGQPEHINLGWDARLDPDGHHEDLTDAEGDLWMRTLHGHPYAVRRSIRQLIAMTQGIISTSRPDSGIAAASNIDQFTPADIDAMQRASGCGRTAHRASTGIR